MPDLVDQNQADHGEGKQCEVVVGEGQAVGGEECDQPPGATRSGVEEDEPHLS